jgi:hypothetical protein
MDCKSRITEQTNGTASVVHCRTCKLRRRLEPGEVFACPSGNRIPCGPGCQLRRTLAWWRLRDDGSCGCHEYAAQMDADGPDGCEARMDEIVAHLVEQAAKRGVILGAIAAASATTLVRRAIDAARAEAAAATPPPG